LLRHGVVSPVRTCLITGFHLGPEPSTACSSIWTRRRLLPLGAGAFHSLFLYLDTPPPPSSCHRLLSSQNSTCKNTLAIWSRLLFLFTRPMKMEENVPKRRHINFRRQEITQKKKLVVFIFNFHYLLDKRLNGI